MAAALARLRLLARPRLQAPRLGQRAGQLRFAGSGQALLQNSPAELPADHSAEQSDTNGTSPDPLASFPKPMPDEAQAYEGHSLGAPASTRASGDSAGVVEFGKHKGQTFEEVLKIAPDYCQFLIHTSEGKDHSGSPSAPFVAWLATQSVPNVPRSGPPMQQQWQPRQQQRQPWQQQTQQWQPWQEQQKQQWQPSQRWQQQQQQKQWPAARQFPQRASAPQVVAPLASGEWVVTFGKHQGRTFSQVFDEERDYVKWLMASVMVGDKIPSQASLALVAYAQGRLLKELGQGPMAGNAAGAQ
eukprot:SRR837773.9742.p1 GENE.SRR837773.9742~~SRR837773.9742.p1  ORF type:complete len:309 (+),score=71.70 SRR837773.9742:30-929(+)